ncbi:ATP-grasp domain-containing protein [Nonomuraea typhae]|uniref:ATP-grasp domain-containing protein n=1 Tax=Nonomuraea typhae TaxID=2603600 RepID=A0ABW7YW65_9ACTN
MHAILARPYGPAVRSKYLAGCTDWTTTGADADNFLHTVLSAADRIGETPVLLPMDDITAIHIARHSHALATRFRISTPPGELPSLLADKGELAAICRKLGVPHPDTLVMETPADLAEAERAYGYPMIAKWAKPWLVTRGRSTTLVHTAEQLRTLADQAGGQPSELLLQRYIPPAAYADWFFHGYFRKDATCGFSGGGRKERAYPPAAGITTLGRWLDNPDIEQKATTLAGSLGYAGILDLDFRYHAGDGQYYLLDFNPRVGAQFRLFTGSTGIDVIRAAYLDLTGQPLGPGAPQHGRTYLVENYDLLRKLAGRSSGGGWLAATRHSDELAWYARDDLRPFAGMVGHTFLRALRGRRA